MRCSCCCSIVFVSSILIADEFTLSQNIISTIPSIKQLKAVFNFALISLGVISSLERVEICSSFSAGLNCAAARPGRCGLGSDAANCGVDVSHGCPLLGLNGRMTGRGRTERPNDRPRPVAAGRPARPRLDDCRTRAPLQLLALQRLLSHDRNCCWRRQPGAAAAARPQNEGAATAGRPPDV